MNKGENSQRIAKNTLMLYFRMLLNLTITLYTSRLILDYLGIEDFGIYNVVGGLVSMFSLISGSLSDAVSRFLIFELGKNDKTKLKNIFSISVSIHYGLAIIIFLAVEILGVWFLNYQMNIEESRIIAANWVLQFSLLTFIINLTTIPYNAAIIANEKMQIFAYVSILNVTLKLLIVYLLAFSSIDSLILYSFLLFLVSIVLRFIYVFYCKKSFEECDYSFYWEKSKFKEIYQFAGWNFLENFANIFKTQAVTILINIYSGVAANAAQGIANQVNNAVQLFATNFIMAVNPQIIKSYAQKNNDEAIKLVTVSSRLSFFLILLLAFPLICETKFVIELWLNKVPDYTIAFVRLILIYTLIEIFSKPVYPLIDATGEIKIFRIGISLILFLNFPLSYLLLELSFTPSSVYYVSIFIALISLIFRFFMVAKITNRELMDFIKPIFERSLIIALFAIFLGILIVEYLQSGWFRIFLVILADILLFILIIIIGLEKNERILIGNLIRKRNN